MTDRTPPTPEERAEQPSGEALAAYRKIAHDLLGTSTAVAANPRHVLWWCGEGGRMLAAERAAAEREREAIHTFALECQEKAQASWDSGDFDKWTALLRWIARRGAAPETSEDE